MIEIILRPRAMTDLVEIESFSVQRFGEDAAARYMADLERALARLSELPESGPVLDDVRPPIRYLSVGKHRIFYDYNGRTVLVARVLHQAMVPGGRVRH